MRMLATAIAACLTVTAAEAACLPNDLGCYVHGGSGLVLDQGRFVPRNDRAGGNYYIDRIAPAATAPRRRVDRYDQTSPAGDASTDTRWRDFDLRDGEVDPWSDLDARRGTPEQQALTDAPYAPADDPYAQPGGQRPSASALRTPSYASQGPADAPQGRATSFFDAPDPAVRR
ncbi:MAG TPA: hypothetical protein VFJ13_11860 [Paracoccaceae bacterium]|nr:hypothetical protein [Paracoccaceae bacterium]